MSGSGFNKISLSDVIAASRPLMRGRKGALLLASLIMIATIYLSVLLAAALAPQVLSPQPGLLDNLMVSIISIVLAAFLLGGMARMSLEAARGNPIRGSMIFSGFPYATRFLTYGLLTAALSVLYVFLPFPLNDAVSYLIGTMLYFSIYFIVDRDSGVLQAIGSSLRLVAANPGAVLLWMLLGLVLAVLGALTLGIGLIWIIPFITISNAMIYVQATEGTAADNTRPQPSRY